MGIYWVVILDGTAFTIWVKAVEQNSDMSSEMSWMSNMQCLLKQHFSFGIQNLVLVEIADDWNTKYEN